MALRASSLGICPSLTLACIHYENATVLYVLRTRTATNWSEFHCKCQVHCGRIGAQPGQEQGPACSGRFWEITLRKGTRELKRRPRPFLATELRRICSSRRFGSDENVLNIIVSKIVGDVLCYHIARRVCCALLLSCRPSSCANLISHFHRFSRVPLFRGRYPRYALLHTAHS